MSLHDNATIDKESALPLYFQLENIIKESIEKGELKGGDKIPSEDELCKLFNISRNTVRKAINDLIKEGILYIERGKGTFVSYKIFDHPSERLMGFSEEMKLKNINPSSKIIEKAVIETPSFLKETFDSDKVYKLKRLRFAGDKPIAIEEAFLPYSKFKNLFEDFTEKDSLYETLKVKFKVVPYYASEIIEATLPNKEEANLLQIQLNQPVFRIKRKTFIKQGEIIEFVNAVYRADLYRITLNLKRI